MYHTYIPETHIQRTWAFIANWTLSFWVSIGCTSILDVVRSFAHHMCVLVVEFVFFVYYLHVVYSLPKTFSFDYHTHISLQKSSRKFISGLFRKILLGFNVVPVDRNQLNECARVTRTLGGKTDTIYFCLCVFSFEMLNTKMPDSFPIHQCVFACMRDFFSYSSALSLSQQHIFCSNQLNHTWTGKRFNCVWRLWCLIVDEQCLNVYHTHFLYMVCVCVVLLWYCDMPMVLENQCMYINQEWIW